MKILSAMVLLGLVVALAPACGGSGDPGPACRSDADCRADERCDEGECVPDAVPDGDADADGAADGDAADADTEPDRPTDADPEPDPDPDPDPEQEQADEQPPPPAGDLCYDAVPFETGGSTNHSTIGASADLDPPSTCTGEVEPGAEVFFRISGFDHRQTYRITVEPLDPLFDPGIYLMQLCPEPGGAAECVAGSDTARSGQAEVLAFTPPRSGSYYLAVDTYYLPGNPPGYAPSGRFGLTVAPVGAAVQCSACTGSTDCAPLAACVPFDYGGLLLERACLLDCEGGGSCPQGFACQRALDTDNRLRDVCYPAYRTHGATSCEALMETGRACMLASPLADDEAQCGADAAGPVDDADCHTFYGLGGQQTYCTVKCASAADCPAGYGCADEPLLPDNYCRR